MNTGAAGTTPIRATKRAQEQALIAAAREGDAGAFETLARTHSPALLNILRRLGASREDAEDALQETFLTAHRALSRFRGDASVKSWLARIAINSYRDMARATRRLLSACTSFARRKKAEPAALEDTVFRQDVLDRVMDSIESLPPRQRETLLLRIREGWTYDEVARHLGITRDAVRINLIEARKKLLRKFGGEVTDL